MADRAAAEVVALDRAGEALAPADAGDVDLAAGRDLLDRDFLADLESVNGLETQFHETLARGDPCLLEVAGGRLVELVGVAVAIGDLQSGVAVALRSLDLHDAHRVDLDDSHGDDLVVDPFLCHADLLADDRLLCHGGSSSVLIEPSPSGWAIHAKAPPPRGVRSTN